MARDHQGPSHENTPKSVLKAPKPQAVALSAADAAHPSKRRRIMLERRARRTK